MSDLRTAFSIANIVVPRGGPKTVPVLLNFNGTNGTILIDGSQIVEQGKIEYLQAVFIDNADNPNALTLEMDLTNQRIICPANAQGYFPILQPNPPRIDAITTVGNIQVGLQFLNVPVQPIVWGGSSGGSSGGLTDAQLRASPIEAVAPSLTITQNDVILVGGNEELVAAGAAENYLLIYNNLGNNPITINIAGNDASVSGFNLNSGGSYELPRGVTNAINVAGDVAAIVTVFMA